MEQVVEITGERADLVEASEEMVQELSIELLSKVGGGVITMPL